MHEKGSSTNKVEIENSKIYIDYFTLETKTAREILRTIFKYFCGFLFVLFIFDASGVIYALPARPVRFF